MEQKYTPEEHKKFQGKSENGFFNRNKTLLLGLGFASLAITGIAIFGAATAGVGVAALASVGGIALIAETVTASFGIPGIIAATVVSFFGGALFGKLIDKLSGENKNITTKEDVRNNLERSSSEVDLLGDNTPEETLVPLGVAVERLERKRVSETNVLPGL